MATTYRTRNLTVDEVFAEFQRFFLEFALLWDNDAPKVHVDMTLGEVAELSDEVDWEEDWLLSLGLSIPLEWWKQWESPTRTVRELCADLATRIAVPISEPVTILGKSCETAGMFLMMKDVLANHGADVSNLAPSSPIEAIARTHPLILNRIRLSRVGRLPTPYFDSPALRLGCLASLATSLGFIVSGLLMSGWQKGLMLGAIPFATFILLTYCGFGSKRVLRFPGIVTFRDFIHAAFDKPVRQKA